MEAIMSILHAHRDTLKLIGSWLLSATGFILSPGFLSTIACITSIIYSVVHTWTTLKRKSNP
jgi:hypothetical protein